MNLLFVLDKMNATGFPIPKYVHYKTKEATASTDESVLDSREKVWFEAVKLACEPMRPLRRELLFRKIADAAERYGIQKDIDAAVSFVERIDHGDTGIRTRGDFHKAAAWLERHAESLSPEIREPLAEHLLEQSVKLGEVLPLSREFMWNEWAGHDPLTRQVRRFAEENLHKLATGNVYQTDQFAAIPIGELRDYLPDLLKTASLGMDVIQPDRLAKIASTVPEREAEILDTLFESHGHKPVHSDFGCPVEIDDTILASL